MPEPANKILAKMLDRLFASLANGPSLNCKPHSSRQRIDLLQLTKLRDVAPEELLKKLLSEERRARILARVPVVRRRVRNQDDTTEEERPRTPEERAAEQAWADQQSV